MIRVIRGALSAILLSTVAACAPATPPAAQAPTAAPTAKPAATTAPAQKAPPAAAQPSPAATAPAAAKPASGAPLKIGVLATLTGPSAFTGDPFAKAVKLAADRVNQSGGVNGQMVEVIAYDTEASADKALTFGRKLLSDDKVNVIIGPEIADNIQALLPVTEEAKIPVLYNSPIIEPKPNSYHFVLWQRDADSWAFSIDWIKERGAKSVAILHGANASGESQAASIERAAGPAGISIVAKETFNLTDRDVTPQLTKIKATNPDAVFGGVTGAPVAVIAKGYTQLGMSQPLLVGTGAVSAAFPQLLKGITPETFIFPTFRMMVPDQLPASEDAWAKRIVEFNKLYEGAHGKAPDFFAGSGWDLANLALDAMKKGGGDGTKIRDAIEQVKDFPGVIAVLNFSPQEHRGGNRQALVRVQFKDDKFMMVK